MKAEGGRGMKLVQTTLFGTRGESFRIKKRSPLAKLAVGEKVDFHLLIGGEVTSAGHTVLEVWPKPNNFGCDAARISGVSGWVSQAALTRTPPDGRSGEADGCLLALAGLIALLIAFGIVTCRPRVTVEWIKEYPDPVCERCGKVLDGTSAVCAEEEKGQ